MLSSLMRPSPLTFLRAASSLSDSDSNMGGAVGEGSVPLPGAREPEGIGARLRGRAARTRSLPRGRVGRTPDRIPNWQHGSYGTGPRPWWRRREDLRPPPCPCPPATYRRGGCRSCARRRVARVQRRMRVRRPLHPFSSDHLRGYLRKEKARPPLRAFAPAPLRV